MSGGRRTQAGLAGEEGEEVVRRLATGFRPRPEARAGRVPLVLRARFQRRRRWPRTWRWQRGSAGASRVLPLGFGERARSDRTPSIKFRNTGHKVVFVQTSATAGGTTVSGGIGTAVQGQAVMTVPSGTQPASTIEMYGLTVAVRPARRYERRRDRLRYTGEPHGRRRALPRRRHLT
jgi:hypothetical protein